MSFALHVLLALSTALAPTTPSLQVQPGAAHDIRPLVEWGALGNIPAGLMRLTLIRLDTNTHASVTVPVPGGASGTIQVPAAVSADDQSAAIAVTTATGVQVLVLRNLRAPTIAQSPRYWIPSKDPNATTPGCKISGAPRFHGNDELWVIEAPGNSEPFRLARYQLGATSSPFLGASDLHDPLHPSPGLSELDWLVHDDTAVFLQQSAVINGQGVEVVRYNTAGGVSARIPVDTMGFAAFHAGFQGIRAVPAHPTWGFVQYGVWTNGTSHARIVDLDTGKLFAPLPVNPGRAGRFSEDGTLAFFSNISDANTLVPVKLPPDFVNGQPFFQLPPVPGFFCGGDSIAAGGGILVTAPGQCAGLVHKSYLDASGQLHVESISPNTGSGLFQFYNGAGGVLRAFYDSTYDRVFNDAGMNLHVETMTYGPWVMVFPTCEVFF